MYTYHEIFKNLFYFTYFDIHIKTKKNNNNNIISGSNKFYRIKIELDIVLWYGGGLF